MTVTTKRKPSTKQRTMQYLEQAHMLFLSQDGKAQGYMIEQCDGGYTLEKSDGERYVIRSGSCTCKGYQRHRHCKHADAIAKLQQLSKLAKPVFTVGEHPHCDFQDP